MLEEGAGVIDVGGESTRPGAARVDPVEQLQRVIEPIRLLVAAAPGPIEISIDTTSADVATAALDAGATMLNDVSAGRDPRMFPLAAERGCPIILMHMLGEPASMQHNPTYNGDVVEVVRNFLLERADAAQAAGVAPGKIILDPGIGFGKTLEHNLRLLAHLDRFVDAGYDVMLGASRKGFIQTLCGDTAVDPKRRGGGTIATTALAVQAGVKYLRVHDVAANAQAVCVAQAILKEKRF